eukprot:m.80104 g.80104  ORF g.80104 m.80104 type:complete len:85 (+) comp20899_c0_seq3:41-295(+)
MPSIDVPEGYGLVLASALSLVPVAVFYGIITVARARKKYGVKYPTLYATEADTKDYKQFNWAQRAHQVGVKTRKRGERREKERK